MNRNLLFGLIAGTLAPGIALGLGSAFLLIVYPEPNKSIFMALVGSVWAGIMFSIPALLIYALPLFLFFKAFRIANIYTCVATALTPVLIVGFIPAAASTIQQQLIFGALFLVSALAFWYFARRTIYTKKSG
jgi:hypothetical protein